MNVKLLGKERTEPFMRYLARKSTVFVPDKRHGAAGLRKFVPKDFLLFQYSNFEVPPAKSFFFPSLIQKYMDFSFDKDWTAPGKKILFGVRPCDAHSLFLLDKAVKDDELYLKRRNEIILIVQGCNAPCSTCFCTSVKGGPFSITGADVFITDIGNSFVVEDISGRAATYLSDLPHAGHDDLYQKEKKASRADKMISTKINMENLPEKLEQAEKEYEKRGAWKRLGEKCTNCSQCTSVCPTCHCCFVVEDVIEMASDELGSKAAGFDPCMLNIMLSSGFSDTDPPPHSRLRRRITDKFCGTMKTIGQPFCVGCGRCVIACTENIDMIEILKAITEYDPLQHKHEDIFLSGFGLH